MKVIDDIIFGILGWTKDDVVIEERVDEDGVTEYLDYQISTGRHSILVGRRKLVLALMESQKLARPS